MICYAISIYFLGPKYSRSDWYANLRTSEVTNFTCPFDPFCLSSVPVWGGLRLARGEVQGFSPIFFDGLQTRLQILWYLSLVRISSQEILIQRKIKIVCSMGTKTMMSIVLCRSGARGLCRSLPEERFQTVVYKECGTGGANRRIIVKVFYKNVAQVKLKGFCREELYRSAVEGFKVVRRPRRESGGQLASCFNANRHYFPMYVYLNVLIVFPEGNLVWHRYDTFLASVSLWCHLWPVLNPRKGCAEQRKSEILETNETSNDQQRSKHPNYHPSAHLPVTWWIHPVTASFYFSGRKMIKD